MLKYTARGLRPDRSAADFPPLAVTRAPLSERLLIPLCAAKGDVTELCAAPGDAVGRAELIAVSEDGERRIYSPVPGRLEGIEKRRKPGVGMIPCAVVRPDRLPPAAERPVSPGEAGLADAAQILAAAKNAAVVDELDGRPLAQKLALTPAGTPVIGAALDDQPGLCADLCVLRCSGETAAAGLRLAAAAVSAEPEACGFAAAGVIPRGYLERSYGGFPVRELGRRYPAAARLRGGEHPPLLVGVQALCALARAVVYGEAQTACAVAVNGEGMACRVLEAAVGTPVGDLLSFLEVTGQIDRLICGGLMTGSVLPPDAPLTPSLRAVTALRTPAAADAPADASACTGCGACADVCPRGLIPFYLMRAIQNGKFDRAAKWNARACTGCGCCSYVCPARLELSRGICAFAQRGEVTRNEP